MNHLIKAIFWLLLALLMAFCCVIDIIGQNWFALVVCIIALVMDTANAISQYMIWLKTSGRRPTK